MQAIFLTLLFLSGITSALAKRAAPESVPPVQYQHYEFRSGRDPASMGVVQVWDLRKQAKLGDIEVYRVVCKPWLEADVQWVFIRSMSLDWPVLTVVNERGKTYRVRVDRSIARFTGK